MCLRRARPFGRLVFRVELERLVEILSDELRSKAGDLRYRSINPSQYSITSSCEAYTFVQSCFKSEYRL